jgi:hypothetical protein
MYRKICENLRILHRKFAPCAPAAKDAKQNSLNRTLTMVLTFFICSLSVFAQNNLTEPAQAIVEEGKLLYRSEMASWHGTDVFLRDYKNLEHVGGYFSYSEKDRSICIFFSKSEKPKVIGEISFDTIYNINTHTAKVNFAERDFTDTEAVLFTIRQMALAEINSDTLFKKYENTSLNLIPLISGDEKKVYVLTGTQEKNIVYFGNDYLLLFDKYNKLILKKKLHNNIIPIRYGVIDGKEIETTVHSHLPESGDFITATDICTLMLHQKYTKWKKHIVVSDKYLNIWNCETNQLMVVPKKQALEEMQKAVNKK